MHPPFSIYPNILIKNVFIYLVNFRTPIQGSVIKGSLSISSEKLICHLTPEQPGPNIKSLLL